MMNVNSSEKNVAASKKSLGKVSQRSSHLENKHESKTVLAEVVEAKAGGGGGFSLEDDNSSAGQDEGETAELSQKEP